MTQNLDNNTVKLIDGGILATKGNVGLGDIRGFVASYTDADTVSICAGYCESNGKYYEKTSATALDIASAGADVVYIYIDDDSSDPAPTFIDDTTAPSWSAAKNGYYNGNDRCIGSVYCSGANTMQQFVVFPYPNEMAGREVEIRIGVSIVLASDMNPSGLWVTPDDSDTDVIVGVMGSAALVHMYLTDTASLFSFAAVSVEVAAISAFANPNYQGDMSLFGSEAGMTSGWVTLGSSSQIKIAGGDNDDNALDANLFGWKIRR
ncbi:MAG: hypothetical protein HOG49_03105 [Candidatus Scalindua sp.]|jgi:hypothetical protein|nr:hypothetical protein [Candidatus Scalindua sp.]